MSGAMPGPGTICSDKHDIQAMLTLQFVSGHFLALHAHWVHIMTWPHGRNLTLAGFSSHRKQGTERK